jgi:branched-chain amino acid aminotransferase
MDIKITKTTCKKEKKPEDQLGFGTIYTDHMFIMDYDVDKGGWYNPRIEPYAPITLEPAAAVLHYSQETFEGLKAYKGKDGNIKLFRPRENAKRMNQSNIRMCMPEINEDDFLEAVTTLVKLDEDWIPESQGTSLYIRPFMFATESCLGVRPAKQYKFLVILSPVGSYYEKGLAPTRIHMEDEYIRAAKGGTGFAKTGGNYSSSMAAQEKAHKLGYDQVLWLDENREYIDEVGTSNAFFVIDDVVVTAHLSGSILPGITRDSVLTLIKDWNIPVVEQKLSVKALKEANDLGAVKEVFATGTAAVISPIGVLGYGKEEMVFNDNKIGELSQKLYDTIIKIQTGELEDSHGWVVTI